MDAFIRKKGVTLCPPCFSEALVLHNLERDKAWAAMTPQQKWTAGFVKRKPGRVSKLSPEERKERQREHARNWYAANKEKKGSSG